MRISKEKIYFIGVFIAFLLIRYMAAIIYPSFPAWDPWSYYGNLLSVLKYRRNPAYNLSSYYMTGIVYVLSSITEATNLNPFDAVKWLSQLIYSILIVPSLYLIGKNFSNSKKAGLIMILLFGISDIGVLRESYTIAEGLAIPFSVIAIYSLIKYFEKGKKIDALLIILTLVSLLFIHHLTMFIIFFVIIATLATVTFIKKVQRKRVFVVISILLIVSLIALFSEAHLYIEVESYHRLSTFIDSLYYNQTKTIYGAMIQKYSAVPKSYTTLVLHHISTLITLLFAFIGFLQIAIKKTRKINEIVLFIWLFITTTFFIVSVLSDYLFGWLFDFYGFRAWIYALVPASIFASKILYKLSNIHVIILPLIIGISAIGTSMFIVYQFDTMNYHHYERYTSDWLYYKIEANILVLSPSSFRPSNPLRLVSNGSRSDTHNVEFFSCNYTYIKEILDDKNYTAIYVMSSERSTEKPFYTSYLTVCYKAFDSNLFNRIYDSKNAWIWKHKINQSTLNATLEASGG